MKHTNLLFKRLTSALTAASLLLIGTISVAADDTEYESVESAVPQKVLVIGDSIATGYGLEGYDNGRENVESYANMLKKDFEKELKQGEEDFTNKAIDGQTSPELLEDLQKGEYDSDLEGCDLVLISIGGNDLLHTLFGFFSDNTDYGISIKDILSNHSVGEIMSIYTDLSKVLEEKLAAYDDNIKDITTYINDKCDARVIVQTLYNPVDTKEKPKLFMAFVKSKIDTLNEKINNNAKDEQGNVRYEIADVFTAFSGQGDKLTNIAKIDIHPNADGHKKIYETINGVIRQKSFTIKVEKPKAEAVQADADKTESSTGSKDKQDDDYKIIVIATIAVASLAAGVSAVTIAATRKKQKGDTK